MAKFVELNDAAKLLNVSPDELKAMRQRGEIAPHRKMRATLDDWIPKILSAQEPDGYLQTAYTLADVQYRRGEYERARFYIDRVNKSADQSNAQTLWLGSRIEYSARTFLGFSSPRANA